MSDTSRIDALLKRWADDGATPGPAFVELRDHARRLEHALRVFSGPPEESEDGDDMTDDREV